VARREQEIERDHGEDGVIVAVIVAVSRGVRTTIVDAYKRIASTTSQSMCCFSIRTRTSTRGESSSLFDRQKRPATMGIAAYC
jgi:hypothetical protein